LAGVDAGRAVPVYPVVAKAAFLIFFGSAGAVFLAFVELGVKLLRAPGVLATSRKDVLPAPGRPVAPFLAPIFAFLASSTFNSLRSFMVKFRSTVLC
jgi:hypothetical protein